jgi:putative colanic acid biosynthesis acetyltransferase WcaF
MRTDLSKFNNSWYKTGAGFIKTVLWYYANIIFLKNTLLPSSAARILILRLFGAKIGCGCVIKPGLNIKYPWKLEIGDHTWIGENVWIDNLADVKIGENVCISQGAMLLCGNHNYKKISFDLIIGTIDIEDGTWIGAQSVVCPGVVCHSHSILAVGSVASANLEPYGIYRGNPAVKVRERVIEPD